MLKIKASSFFNQFYVVNYDLFKDLTKELFFLFFLAFARDKAMKKIIIYPHDNGCFDFYLIAYDL